MAKGKKRTDTSKIKH